MIKKVEFLVSDMHCVNCALRLQDLEDLLPGVINVNASYHKGRMVVTFDETRVTIQDLIRETKNLGYTALVKITD
jgi:copper chaperone CopZ